MATNKNNEDEFDEFDEFEDDEPKSPDSSDLLKSLRKKTRADEKRIKDLETEINSFKKARNDSVLKTILDQKGINPKASALIAKELDEVTEETVTEWLKLNGDIFGIAETNDNENDPNLQELRKQDNLTKSGMTSTNESDLISKLQNSSEADFLNMLRAGGANI